MPMDRLTRASLIGLPLPFAPRGLPASVTPRCNDRYMSVISLLAVLIGIAIGAVLGFLFARSREASAATGLAARASAAEERARAAGERAALVEGQLAERFQSLSAQALDASTRRFLEMAEGRLDAANAKAAGELETRRAAVENLEIGRA